MLLVASPPRESSYARVILLLGFPTDETDDVGGYKGVQSLCSVFAGVYGVTTLRADYRVRLSGGRDTILIPHSNLQVDVVPFHLSNGRCLFVGMPNCQTEFFAGFLKEVYGREIILVNPG